MALTCSNHQPCQLYHHSSTIISASLLDNIQEWGTAPTYSCNARLLSQLLHYNFFAKLLWYSLRSWKFLGKWATAWQWFISIWPDTENTDKKTQKYGKWKKIIAVKLTICHHRNCTNQELIKVPKQALLLPLVNLW